jgi:hypothetical protein
MCIFFALLVVLRVRKEDIIMSEITRNFSLEVEETDKTCAIGEKIGKQNIAEGKIPVLSCEGGCIRGELARLAANMVAKEEPYGRGCHGELLSVPHSAIAQWIKNADKVVLIDGCFLQCHGRILKNLLGEDHLIQFDALSHYKKYRDLFDIDAVREAERKEVARDVADWVIASLGNE